MMTRPTSDREAVTLALEGLSQLGYTIESVADDTWNLDERTVILDVQDAIDMVMGVDDAFVFVITPDDDKGWIRFVLGNDPEEVVADYTTILDPELGLILSAWWV